MTTIDITSEEVRAIMKGKKILVIGDSISRGIYKDLACLLHGNDRLLKSDELLFNRHNNKHLLFDEVIENLHVDRSNSINNIEKRKLILKEDDCLLYYCFCSRIWNKSMDELLLSVGQYDYIFIQSLIWDLSRYRDPDGKYYLQNLHICLSNMKRINKNTIWINLPPPDSCNKSNLTKLILKMHVPIMEVLKQYSCLSLDLHDKVKNHPDTRHNDGVHFTPKGHRIMTYYLIQTISTIVSEQQNIIEHIAQSSSRNNLDYRNNPNVVNALSKEKKHINIHRKTKRHRGDSTFNSEPRSQVKRPTLRPIHRLNMKNNLINVRHQHHHGRVNQHNQTMFRNEAEQFGRAFGIAWSTFRHL